MALSEAVKEVTMVRVDSVGATFMVGNVTVTSTKHVDIRYKYVNEYVEDGIVKILFMKSEKKVICGKPE